MTRFSALLALLLLLPACDAFGSDDGDDPAAALEGFPVLFDGQWGFIDLEGRLVTSPRFDFADQVFGGLSAVRQGASWGYARPDGSVVVEPQYVAAGPFRGRIAPVRSASEGWFYIDQSGARVGEAGYDSAEPISDGRAAVRRDFLWGYVNEDGALEVEPQFAAAGPFVDGIAPVQTSNGWQYITRSGEAAFGGSFEEAGPFSDVGLAPVRESGSEVWKFIDRDGRIAINSTFEAAAPFSEGFAAVRQNGRTAFIGADGEFLVVPKLAQAESFSQGRAAVRFNSRWTYIRRDDGLIVTSPAYTSAKPFRGGLAQVTTGSEDDDNLRVGYVDLEGDVVWEPTR
ncbi:WG repeat-containing protein [Rubrivirga sp.]|uniref:WG repeat-containing protein n=1 Tax=Rubrivirga sp. TaxID=1885344 RepID=UPI003C72EF48